LEKTVGDDGKARPAKPRRGKKNPMPLESFTRDDDDLDDDLDEPRRQKPDPWNGHPWNDPTKQAKFAHAVDLIKLGVDPYSEQVAALMQQATAVTIIDKSYDPFAGRSEAEIVEWYLLTAFLSFDASAGRDGHQPKDALLRVEWILQRPFQNVAEWLGPEGDKFRNHWDMRPLTDEFKTAWAAFLAERRDYTQADADRELERLQDECEQALAEGRLYVNGRKPNKQRGSGMIRRRPANG